MIRVVWCYTKSIEINDGDADAYYNRAILLAEDDDIEGAIEDYSSAIALYPYDMDYFFNRALLYDKQEEYGLACRDYQSAANLGDKQAGLIFKQYCK